MTILKRTSLFLALLLLFLAFASLRIRDYAMFVVAIEASLLAIIVNQLALARENHRPFPIATLVVALTLMLIFLGFAIPPVSTH